MLNATRQFAMLEYPYYSSVLSKVRFVIREELEGLACVDQNGCIYWSLKQTSELIANSRPEHQLKCLSFVLLHECLHVLRDHHARSQSAHFPKWAKSERKRHHLWNIAADLEINTGLRERIALLPASVRPLLPEDFGFNEEPLAESYLAKISKSALDQMPFWDEGSGVFAASNRDRDWEVGLDKDSESSSPSWTSLERNLIRSEVADAILKSNASSRREFLWAQSLQRRNLDWRSILRSKIRSVYFNEYRAGATRVDYRRPSRLQRVSHPLCIPTRRAQERFQITMVVDTSGSMNETLLKIAMHEVNQLARMIDLCSVDVLQCDEEVVSYISCYRPSDRFEIRGGLGTDMVRGIQFALGLEESTIVSKERVAPNVIIVFTDGFTPFPRSKYKTPVLWCIIGDSMLQLPEPWTEDDVIRISNQTESA
jgi:predicted metal-dependent peptidase